MGYPVSRTNPGDRAVQVAIAESDTQTTTSPRARGRPQPRLPRSQRYGPLPASDPGHALKLHGEFSDAHTCLAHRNREGAGPQTGWTVDKLFLDLSRVVG